MRIVGGRWRARKLADIGAGDAAAHLRPTSDRARETLFNLLTNGKHGDLVRDARVLDLFAGSGALGLEALSRGAAWATFIDNGAVSHRLLRENIGLCNAADATELLRRDATTLGVAGDRRFDLVFLDPPYGRGLGERAIASALEGDWIAPGGMVVWEEEAPPMLTQSLRLRDQRRLGRTILTLATFD